ncbi:MAG: hypothetical protein KC589_05520 [Nanoarchaeota archaeon]|nr:hypothetical protein [Nanoarchaeota archaeon]
MNSNKLILAGAHHLGGANSIMPVVNKLRSEGYEVPFYVSGVVYKSLSSKVGENEFKLPGFYSCKGLEELFNLEGGFPKAVLVGTSVTEPSVPVVLDQMFVKIARDLDIPSVGVLDNWKSYIQRFTDNEGKLVYLPDTICVMDELAKNEMIFNGIAEENILVTGNPAKDSLISRKKNKFEERANFRKHLGLGEDERIIFYMGQPLADENGVHQDEVRKRTFFDLISSIPDGSKLVVRSHPRETLQDLLDIASLRPFKGKVVFDNNDFSKRYDMVGSLLGSDVNVAVHSDTLNDSISLGVPAISIQKYLPSRYRVDLPGIRAGTMPVVSDSNSVFDILNNVLGNPQNYIRKINFRSFTPQKNATENVVDVIKNYI